MKNILPYDIFEKYFSCFSGHMLEYEGVLYTTTEHAYHCQRYTDPAIVDEIKQARSAIKAWEISQRHKSDQKPDWNDHKVEVMEALFRAKLDQHDDVKKALIKSGNATIVKHQPLDVFWGDGPDGSGQNEMGKLWMKLRSDFIG